MSVKTALLTVVFAIPLLAAATRLDSGLRIGDRLPEFHPVYVTGGEDGRSASPTDYAAYPGVLVWVNHDNEKNVLSIISILDAQISALNGFVDVSGKKSGAPQAADIRPGPDKIKAFMIFTNPNGLTEKKVIKVLKTLQAKGNLRHVALTYVAGPSDPKSAALYRIDPAGRNTILLYKNGKVVGKFVDFTWSASSARVLADPVTALVRG